jgi:hypothetical protein
MNKLGIALSVGVVAAAGGFFAGTMAAPTKTSTATALKDVKWTPLDPKVGDKGAQFSVVFGDMQKKAPIGFLLKMPAGGKPGPHTHSSDDYGVSIQGSVHNFASPGTDEGPALTAGGTWFQPAKMAHDNHCDSKEDCIDFIYMPNGFDFKPAAPPKAADPKPADPKPATPKK